jgi:hypothetical protein
MASMTFDLVQQLVDRLTAAEQAQLLAYLAPKLAGAISEQERATEVKAATWADFFSAGDALQDDPATAGQSPASPIVLLDIASYSGAMPSTTFR